MQSPGWAPKPSDPHRVCCETCKCKPSKSCESKTKPQKSLEILALLLFWDLFVCLFVFYVDLLFFLFSGLRDFSQRKFNTKAYISSQLKASHGDLVRSINRERALNGRSGSVQLASHSSPLRLGFLTKWIGWMTGLRVSSRGWERTFGWVKLHKQSMDVDIQMSRSPEFEWNWVNHPFPRHPWIGNLQGRADWSPSM